MKNILIPLSILALTACSADDSDDEPSIDFDNTSQIEDNQFTGVYYNTDDDITLFIKDDSSMHIIHGDTSYYCNILMQESQASCSLAAVYGGLDGELMNDSAIIKLTPEVSGLSAELSIDDNTYSVNFDMFTDKAGRELSGTYTTDNLFVTFVFDNLNLSGSNGDGCQFTGEYNEVVEDHTFYDGTLYITSCDELNGSYESYITVGLNDVASKEITITFVNNKYFKNGTLNK